MGHHPDTLFPSSSEGMEIPSDGCKTEFLNGDLKEKVFMSQPEGFFVKGQEHKVCKLVK